MDVHTYTQTGAPSTPPPPPVGVCFSLFISVSNSLRVCVSYLSKHTTGNSKDTASPNLSVQSCHTSLSRERRGPSTPPPRHRDFPPRVVFTQTRDPPEVLSAANLTDRTKEPTQTHRRSRLQPVNDLTVHNCVANVAEFTRPWCLIAFALYATRS